MLSGEVLSPSGPISGATVTLRLFGLNDRESAWSISSRTGTDGRFVFNVDQFPVRNLAASVYAASATITAAGFRSDTIDLLARRDSMTISTTPRSISVSLEVLDRQLFIYLLLPGALGLILALLSLTTSRLKLLPKGPVYHYAKYHPAVYVLSVTVAWLVTAAILAKKYVTSGQDAIPLGNADITVPSALVIAALLGTLTYVAYAIYVRSPDFLQQDGLIRTKLLLVIAGRILVAPYIAIIAFGIFAPAFPQLYSPAYVLFFGYFTGVWIKPVLEALDALGKRLLSEESRARVDERTRAAERRERIARTVNLLQKTSDAISLTTNRGTIARPIDRTRIALRLRTETDAPVVAKDLLAEHDPAGAHEGFHVFRLSGMGATDYAAFLEQASRHPRVVQVSPVFGAGTSQYSLATDRVSVRLKAPADTLPSGIDAIATKFGGVTTRVSPVSWTVTVRPPVDPFEVAAELSGIAEVDFAEPKFISFSAAAGAYAPQVFFPSGDGGRAFDMLRVPEAWSYVSTLNPTHVPVIAVLDNGVDVDHQDLKSGIHSAFDTKPAGTPFLAADCHGTECAGLTAATPAGDGMRGIADGARIMAVRISHTPPDRRLSMDDADVEKGIDWAVANGADVLSLSWTTIPSHGVQAALERAAQFGRGGRGCVIVAAAGNFGGGVSFPAVLPCAIAVAGTDVNGRLNKSNGWESAYGGEIDVAAPGIATFTTTHGDSAYSLFTATSAATAMVAGAAALVLRVNPALTAKQVRDLLIATSQLNVGNGQPLLAIVDVLKAVQVAAAS